MLSAHTAAVSAEKTCQAEGVVFRSKVELMVEMIRDFVPLADTHIHSVA
jgi:hypothetical protein